MTKKSTNVRLTEEELEDLRKIAESEHRSVSNLISVWIAEHKAQKTNG